MKIRTLIKEPALHFILLGAMLFILYGLRNESEESINSITISTIDQQVLMNLFEKTWQRKPSTEEMQKLIDNHIRLELAYREGQKLALDQDDAVIRRRVQMKLESLAEEIASIVPPDETVLRNFYKKNTDQFIKPETMTIRHVYVQSTQDLEAISVKLKTHPDAYSQLGSPSLFPNHFDKISSSHLDRNFGDGFSNKIQTLKVKQWSKPIISELGYHFVYIEQRQASELPDFEEVRQNIEREWLAKQQEQAIDALYDKLTQKYKITVETL